MGWGTEINCNIFFNKLNIESNIHANDMIEEEYNNINKSIGALKILIGSNPRDIIPDDWKEDPEIWLNNKSDEYFDEIKESIRLITDLKHYLNDNIND